MAESIAEVITCPACKRTLQVPASFFGQTVQCPECRHQFTAQSNDTPAIQAAKPAPIPPREPEPEPAPRRRRDDDLDDDHLYDVPHIRQTGAPHRGGMIMALGLIGLVVFPWATIICGPMAWVMGNTDMTEIRAGRMDPSGEGMVQAGRILGIIGTVLLLVSATFFCGIIGLIVSRG
jgi:hypothetical protein